VIRLQSEFQAGNLQVHVSQTPLVFTISTLKGREIQRLKIEPATGVVSFATGNSPLLGLGEGGPQFDRRGSTDSMASGQGAYRLVKLLNSEKSVEFDGKPTQVKF
jgi:alpha-glucosidase/alpha-D-xyloside xylohydrolase